MFKHFKSDLPASMVVFFIAMPLCLGNALANGASLSSGLIMGIVGSVVAGSGFKDVPQSKMLFGIFSITTKNSMRNH